MEELAKGEVTGTDAGFEEIVRFTREVERGDGSPELRVVGVVERWR